MNRQAPLVLGLETSCDETSVALLRGEHEILSQVICSQDEHAVFGGVVPEIAARAHLRIIDQVVDAALQRAGVRLEDVDIFGVTVGPGLIGGLLVGTAWAKAAAYALKRPLVPVHHMEAHLFAAQLEDPAAQPPFVALLVSGGHTMLLWVPEWGNYSLLGQTRDDAAGEAFDKVAKLLGLGFPGGPHIERLAASGSAQAHSLPRPMLAPTQRPGDSDYFDFSFSGLKTAVGNLVREIQLAGRLDEEVPDLAAAFQAAVIDVLTAKALRATVHVNCRRLLLGGGVAASSALRSALHQGLGPSGRLYYPSVRLSTDNGAMIARTALFRYQRGEIGGLDVAPMADLPFPGLRDI